MDLEHGNRVSRINQNTVWGINKGNICDQDDHRSAFRIYVKNIPNKRG